MRILFVLEWPVVTGGVRVVYEHASRLIARGHEVTLLTPPIRMPPIRSGSRLAWKRYLIEIVNGGIRDGLRSYGLEETVTHFDPRHPSKVPAADAVIATAWRTAEWVAGMPDSAGRRFYLVQQYEAWSEDIRGRVDATWKLPLRKVVIAGWLERLARERFGEKAWRIPNGVDFRRFHPPREANGTESVVGMLYEPLPWKGIEDGLAAFHQIAHERHQARFLLFGRGRLRHSLPPRTRYVSNPRQDRLVDLYGAAGVFVNPSHSEGFSLVILEAMACGCAVVATAVGEVPEMGRPGEDYEMVPPRDPSAIATAVKALLDAPERRRAIAEAGRRLAGTYTWDRATKMLETILLES
jgi:glycosyltransferase involved in cell wall biosynthesis